MANVFFTTVDEDVRATLKARSKHYGAIFREQDDFKFLFGKTAWIDATAVNENLNISATLAAPTGGGLGKGGLYSQKGYLPKPHIEGFNTNTTGEFGSLRRGTLSFTVYTAAQLDAYMPFLTLGAKVTVTYGWSTGGTASGKNGKYEGFVVNFNISQESNGAYTCSTELIGPGSFAIGGMVEASSKPTNSVTDASGTLIEDTTFFNQIRVDVEKFKAPEGQLDATTGFCHLQQVHAWVDAERSAEEEPDKTQHPGHYIDLEHIFQRINQKILTEAGGQKIGKIKFICNEETTRSVIPNWVISADPDKIIFPGKSSYGTTPIVIANSTIDKIDYADLSKAMVSTDFILNDLKTQVCGEGKSGKLFEFIALLLDSINRASGNVYKLTVIQEEENPLNWLVVDSEYLDEEDVQLTEIMAVVNGGFCRSVDFSISVPDDMATTAFIASESSFAKNNPGTLETILGRDTTADVTLPDDPILGINNVLAKFTGPMALSMENRDELRAALDNARIALPQKKKKMVFPIEFSFTLDGIEGFKFSNALTYNYLPTPYKDFLVTFTVNDVSQNISGGDWVTTVTTICRITPKNGV